jgi:hypothetical protein
MGQISSAILAITGITRKLEWMRQKLYQAKMPNKAALMFDSFLSPRALP